MKFFEPSWVLSSIVEENDRQLGWLNWNWEEYKLTHTHHGVETDKENMFELGWLSKHECDECKYIYNNNCQTKISKIVGVYLLKEQQV